MTCCDGSHGHRPKFKIAADTIGQEISFGTVMNQDLSAKAGYSETKDSFNE